MGNFAAGMGSGTYTNDLRIVHGTRPVEHSLVF